MSNPNVNRSYLKGVKRSNVAHTITLEEYKALEAEGKLNRPLTDYPMGVRKHQLETINPKKITTIDEVIAKQDKD
jgi:hypothetical protein